MGYFSRILNPFAADYLTTGSHRLAVALLVTIVVAVRRTQLPEFASVPRLLVVPIDTVASQPPSTGAKLTRKHHRERRSLRSGAGTTKFEAGNARN